MRSECKATWPLVNINVNNLIFNLQITQCFLNMMKGGNLAACGLIHDCWAV